MHRERLEKMVDLMKRVHEDRRPFQILTWMETSDGITLQNLEAYAEWQCNTPACAIGWAVRDPWFQSQGLTYCIISDRLLVPLYQRQEGFNAVSQFFDIGLQDAQRLFSVEGYELLQPTALHVSRLVAEFLAAQPEAVP